MTVKLGIFVSLFERIAVELGPCELERGEVVPMSPGGMPHSRYASNLADLLEHWARRSRRGRVFINEAGVLTERDLDPKGRRLCNFRPDDEPELLDQSATIRDPEILPGFRIRVREFFV